MVLERRHAGPWAGEVLFEFDLPALTLCCLQHLRFSRVIRLALRSWACYLVRDLEPIHP